MLYIINRNIHFRNTDGALWREDENEPSSITLTVTTSRLLTFLLERHGEVASRDDILETVWTAHGLRSSNNSLNKYIADLRKIFGNLELTGDVIITVPKIGFMFTKEIDVDKQPVNVDSAHFVNEQHCNVVYKDDKADVAQKKSKVSVISFLLILILGIAPILLSEAGMGVKLSGITSLPESNSYLLGNVEGCDIYTLQQSSVEMTVVKLSIAKKLINKTGLHCLDNTRFFFNHQTL